ncbi:MAG: glycosyltransferase family 39 protein [candidate division KSB1 bacterium]|nr:glycosyltransferase family 39 protein [candidate division KSB1 bacterium]
MAALLLSVNFLHVRHSHFGTVDVPSAFFGVLCLFFCALMMQHRKTRYTILAAASVSLAVATKFSMLFLVLPFLWAHFSQAPLRQWLERLKDRQLWIGAATGILSFLIACPLIWLDFNETWGGFLGAHRFEQAGKIGSGGGFLSYWTGQQAPGFGVFYPNSIPETMGIILSLSVIIGIVIMMIRHKKSDLLLLLFMLPTYFMFEDMLYQSHAPPAAPRRRFS